MKQPFRKILIAALVLCTFVGVLPMITAENLTAKAATTTTVALDTYRRPGR